MGRHLVPDSPRIVGDAKHGGACLGGKEMAMIFVLSDAFLTKGFIRPSIDIRAHGTTIDGRGGGNVRRG